MILPHRELPSWDTFVSYFGKLLINSFSIRTDRLIIPDPVGSGLFLAASIFDHSCQPNAQTVFKGRKLIVKATENISEFAQVRLSYIDVLADRDTRNGRLEAIWYFTCQCPSCSFQTDQEYTKRSLKCLKCGSPRILDSEDLSFKSQSCPNCGQNNDEEASRLRLYKYLLKSIQNAKGNEEMLEKIIPEMLRTFHGYDCNLIEVLRRLQQWHHSNRNYQKCVEYGQILSKSLNFYQLPHHSGLPLLFHQMAEAYLALNNPNLAKECMEKADSHYKIIPGIEHPFYQLDFEPLKERLMSFNSNI